MIQCDRLPPNNHLVFSDDRALMPPDFNDHIQGWLSEGSPSPYVSMYEVPGFTDWNSPWTPDFNPVRQVRFRRQYWRLDTRVFIAAVCLDREWQILGPEIDPRDGHVVGPSPVAEVVIHERDQPPASLHELSKMSAEVWATLSDAERERHPKIGQVAAMADLDALL